MSKKQAKSERNIDLPDWADDVTPADEVMKKFYAPTGAFRRGPVASPAAVPAIPSAPISNQATSDQFPRNDSDQQIENEVQAAAGSPSPHLKEQQETSDSQSNSLFSRSQQRYIAETPIATATLPELERKRSSDPNTADFATARRSGDESTSHIVDVTSSTSFEEFARKWKMYLYPGQLAVMRTLYEVTFAVGSNECFTRYSEIAKATKMSRRNCINVMNALVDRGFVERLEIRNDATSKGIRLRVHPNPQS